jgi:hypothetical protein
VCADLPWVVRVQGNAAYKAGRYAEAADLYTRALAVPGAAPLVARANRAMALLKLQRYAPTAPYARARAASC